VVLSRELVRSRYSVCTTAWLLASVLRVTVTTGKTGARLLGFSTVVGPQ